MAPARRQHYLPAAFIGGFAADTTGRSRERGVWVGRVGVAAPFKTKAENVGYRRDLYTLNESPYVGGETDPFAVDRWLSASEGGLPNAVRTLVDSRESCAISAHTWSLTLVPFVAGLFVRTPEFAVRFQLRMERLFGSAWRDVMKHASADNTNLARIFEFQRLRAPVMWHRWTVIHFEGESPSLITSDVGYAPHMNTRDGAIGYVVPLRPNAALGLSRQPGGVREVDIAWSGTEWITRIEHVDLDPSDASSLNDAIAAHAVEEIYGKTNAAIAAVLPLVGSGQGVAVGPDLLADSSAQVREAEMDWFEFIGFIGRRPPELTERRTW